MAASGMVTLIMRQGPRPNQAFELTKDVYTIGREAGNDITLEDPQISRHHARLTRQGNSYVIEDLGSTNGAFVNGRRVSTPVLLSNGDMLGFADTIVLAVQVQNPVADATVVNRNAAVATSISPSTAPAFGPPPPPVRSAAAVQQSVQAQPQPGQPSMQQGYVQSQPMPSGYVQPTAKSSTSRYVLISLGCLVLLAIVAAIFLVAWSFIDCASFRSVFGNIVPITC